MCIQYEKEEVKSRIVTLDTTVNFVNCDQQSLRSPQQKTENLDEEYPRCDSNLQLLRENQQRKPLPLLHEGIK